MLLFCKILELGSILAGNKTCEQNTEISMATIYVFIVVIFLSFGQKRAFLAVCAYFRPFLVFSSNLCNF